MPEEIKQEVVLKTQKYLGKYVKKPALTEKLLKKPPFRFLHDIINAVVRDTGFLAGLFTPEELKSDNVKEKEAKIAFLTKLIDAVKTITSTELGAKPSKIIAGLEPTETNVLLQTIGKAIEKKIDSSAYVNGVKPKKEKVKRTPRDEAVKLTDRSKPKQRTKESKGNDKPAKKPAEKKEPIKKALEQEQEVPEEPKVVPIKEPEEVKYIEEPPPPKVPDEVEVPKRVPSAARPKSARPRSGDLREKQGLEVNAEVLTRIKSSLRPPSVRPTSARPGAPRLRPDSAFPIKEAVPMGKINVIVENFDKDLDEEETVIIQTNPEILEEKTSVSEIPENKGHLVEQILEQIQESSTGDEVEKQHESYYGKDAIIKETSSLRVMIQSLTKTANPLGKLLNYLHEDMDAMQVELESWTTTKKQLFEEIAKQKKITKELNKPLLSSLDRLVQEIKKLEEEIASSRSNILRNDTRIKELLSK